MKWKQPTPSGSLQFREGGGVVSSPRPFAGALGWVCRAGDPWSHQLLQTLGEDRSLHCAGGVSDRGGEPLFRRGPDQAERGLRAQRGQNRSRDFSGTTFTQ